MLFILIPRRQDHDNKSVFPVGDRSYTLLLLLAFVSDEMWDWHFLFIHCVRLNQRLAAV